MTTPSTPSIPSAAQPGSLASSQLSAEQLSLLLDPEKEKEWVEALLNVPSEDEGLVRWVVTEQQNRILTTSRRYRKLIIVKGRQTRCSTINLAKNIRRATTTYGQNFVIITQTAEMTQNFRQFIKDRLQDLAEVGLDYEIDIDNDAKLRLKKMKSTFHFASAEQKVGLRGIQTAHHVHASEVAHWAEDSAKRIIGGLLPASPANGSFVMESTPNGAAGQFYEKAMDALAEPGLPWTVQFYPWWLENKYTINTYAEVMSDAGVDLDKMRFSFMPAPDEETLMNREHLDVNQMLWRRMRTRDLMSTGAYFAQEYPEDLMSCWLASGTCYFHDDLEDHLSYYRSSCLEPSQKLAMLDYSDPVTGVISPIDLQGPNLRVWEKPIGGHRYVLFLDCSAGVQGGDYSALTVLDTTDSLRHVATVRMRTLPGRMGHIAAAVGAYYNWGFLGVERNTYGLEALERLKEDHYPNLYYDVVNQPQKPELGWYTGEAPRALMLSRFREKVFNHSIKLQDLQAVVEMGGFTWHKVTGRTGVVQFRAEAERGNDDMVISLAGAVTIAPYAPARVKSGNVNIRTAVQTNTVHNADDIVVGAGGVVQVVPARGMHPDFL